MKHIKNSIVLFSLLFLAGIILYFSLQGTVRASLDNKVQRSLELIQQASAYIVKEDYQCAVQLLEKAHEYNRLNPEAYALLGLCYYEMDNYSLAYKYLVNSYNMGMVAVETAEMLVHILVENGYLTEANRYLRTTTREFPDDKRVILLNGKLNYYRGNYKESVEGLSELLQKEPVPDVYKYLGLSYFALGKEEQAEEYLIAYQESKGLKAASLEAMHRLAEGDGF